MDSNIFDEIRSRCDLVEVVSEYVPLSKKGSNFYGLCPFHTEKTPSFAVNPARQFFHCFGCGEGGNVFNFLMKVERIPFMDAARTLAKRCGVVLEDRPGMREASTERERLHGLLSDARDFYHDLLMNSPARSREYLDRRDISQETVGKFRLGFASNEWDSLYRYFHAKDVSDELLVRSGLVCKRKKGAGYYDRFAGRLIFPIHDSRARVVGFGGRIIEEGEKKQAKYINSPETPIFHKSKTLFGLAEARREMEKSKRAVVVEGYMDCIRAHQMGVENVVATLGTALTPAHVRALRGWVEEAVIVFDSDEAGAKGAQRSLAFFQDTGILAKVAVLAEGDDPDDFIRREGGKAFRERVEKAAPLMEFIISRAVGQNDPTTLEGQIRCVEQVLPSLGNISNRVERGFYLKRLAEKAGIEEKNLLAELDRAVSSGRMTAKKDSEHSTPGFGALAERYLIALALTDKKIGRQVAEQLQADHFRKPLFRSLFISLGTYVADDLEVDLQAVLMSIEEDGADEFLSRLAFEVPPVDDPHQAAENCIQVLKQRLIKAERRKIRSEYEYSEKGIDKEILAQYQKLRKREKFISSPI
jgi:DNA primase